MITLAAAGAAVLQNWRIAVAAAALAAAGAAGWTANGWRLQSRIEALQSEHNALRAEASRRTATAEAQQRSIEAQRAAAHQEVIHVASLARTRDENDRRAADAAGHRLRADLAAVAARARAAGQDSIAAGSREAACAADVVRLADMLSRTDEAAGELASAVDASRTAGLACVAAYEALSHGPIMPATTSP